MSSAAELTAQLSDRGDRPAGSDAERRTAVWLADQINANPNGRYAELETFWCRPAWTSAQVWHILLAIAGSLLAPTQPKIGAALIFLALVFMLADWALAASPGRYLTRERASQNVVAAPITEAPVTLIVTAGYDSSRLDVTQPGWLPGWMFWLALMTLWLLVTALLRVEETHIPSAIAVLQVIPTILLVLAGSALLILGRRSDNAGGVAAAIQLTRTLDAAPPTNLAVELVLSGGASTYGLGLRRHLRTRRRELDATNTVVLGIEGGENSWYLASDGPLLPQGYFRALRRLALETGMLEERSQRGCASAFPARMRQLPAITIGGDPDTVLTGALILVDGIDAYVASLREE